MAPKRFRIAFSFAGEKRDFVADVTDILARRFDKDHILYDRYHEAEFARRDLGIYLPDLYHDQSDLVVVVVCPDYNEKEWTGLEWMAIHDLLKKRKDEEVMLCRFGHATVKGVHSNAGWMDLDDKSPKQAATLVLERLALNEGRPRNYYLTDPWALSEPPRTTIPNNLPRLQSFFGRAEELKQIRDALDPENRTWGALIDGPGGMGKTSLAVRAAYDCPTGQFARIVFVSVKSRELDADGERPLNDVLVPGFLEMLNEVARQLDEPDIPKSPENQRIRLLLDALRPKRVLLVLDNLESLPKSDRDRLFTFVKRLPEGCKAILTSRRRIGSGSEELILQELDQDAALATLAGLARHNDLLARTTKSERVTLWERTGGNPLLLRWLAGQLGRGSCRTLADAFRFLAACPPHNDPLEFVFGDLADEFTADETKVLCTLTYFTCPAEIEHVADVARLEKVPTETALKGLANRSLVTPDLEENAYALVPMVAEFLRRKCPAVVAKTGSWLERRAFTYIVEYGGTTHGAFHVLERAWPTIAPALGLFLVGPDERLQVVHSILSSFLEFTGRWDEWLSLCLRSEAKAVADGELYYAGWRASQAGYAYYLRGEADAVLTCAERAQRHWSNWSGALGGLVGLDERCLCIRLRGLGHELRRDYGAAISAFQEALDLRRAVRASGEAYASALNDLAGAERLSGDLAGAERGFRQALAAAHNAGDTEGVATYTGNLAELSLDHGKWSEAEDLARKALHLSEKLGRLELVASSCNSLAHALSRQGRQIDGLAYARRSVDIYTQLRSPDLGTARQTLRECGM